MSDPKELEAKFDKFLEQYEKDMRGDKTVNGGTKGVVDHVRDFNDYITENPSMTWLLRHKTIKTVLAVVGVISLVNILLWSGIIAVANFLGVAIAAPPLQ